MLIARDLECTRGGRRLFRGVGLQVAPGEWVHVRGANGAGKTSLLRILAGLARPDAGEVRWCDAPIATDATGWRTDLLYLGHAPGLKDDLTPVENLRTANELEGRSLSAADARQALSSFGLARCADLPVRSLSAGQRRRVLLARTRTRRARVWILDEPLTALDVDAVESFAGTLGSHLAGGGLAVVTSHQSLPLAAGRELHL